MDMNDAQDVFCYTTEELKRTKGRRPVLPASRVFPNSFACTPFALASYDRCRLEVGLFRWYTGHSLIGYIHIYMLSIQQLTAYDEVE